MKSIAVLSVAFYSEQFSRAFIGSFRKHYPEQLLVVVDNNMIETEDKEITEMGRRESRYLEQRNNGDFKFALIQNESKNRSHGIGLDVGMKALYSMGIEVAITVDIDSVFLKPGLINKCLELYGRGYMIGGRQHYPHKERAYSYVHPSLAMYDVFMASHHSFEDEAQAGAKSTGEELDFQFMMNDAREFSSREIEQYVHHFGGGSVLRLGANFCRQKLLNDKGYQKKLLEYFDREDVKEWTSC